MKLTELLAELPEKSIHGDAEDIDVSGIVYDPLRVKPGYLFVAINIYTQLNKIEIPDGHDVVAEAVKNGAAAVVLQKDMALPDNVVKIVVPESRYALAKLAGLFYGHPSNDFTMIGITGTNGKTTTTHIIESIFEQKFRTGLIGTLYYKINGTIFKSKDTTPEPPDLQEIFTRMKQEHVNYCAMEVSSHGIDFFRVEGIKYHIAIFTNLTRDHLDFHKTIENYRATKMKLFNWLNPDDYAVINIDDPSSSYFIESSNSNILTYAIHKDADIMAKNIEMTIKGMTFTLVTPDGEIDVKPKLIGYFNVYNILAAAGSAVAEKIDLETIKKGLEQNIRVSGRFEIVDKGQPFSVIVDYAHTPDGIQNVLQLAKDLKPNRIITVFGCGGDRDKEKRPIMGKIVSDLSDHFIITADNPRTEDPKLISNDIKAGITHTNYDEIIDRRAAIEKAIKTAREGDIVMLLGKGHETTQTLKTETIHFNDVEVAEDILSSLA
ncbi:MAG: UDP-N-acetylmuramoyl-L-alanyl-D-glutamate--2,6-diaminopimelate ligase [candidate division KSB1 bacterium]|jgi:UDP-N-acetylmuramoyl-L-alanyl-D-glutamate--2,6-diaminopimelate ligase|nr:UDP-N-acetylmuramoyl-L-alanyl-D-glutamate--2,6-diaminopimelate ligase [candidate division KSB1 bacterium]